MRGFLLFMSLSSVLVVGCGSDCPNVEPCFSYMPHFAEVQILDGATNQPLTGQSLEKAIKSTEATCNNDTGVCTFYVPAADSIELLIELEGYQAFSDVYNVERQNDQYDGGCKITGCVLSTDIPATIGLEPID